MSVDERACVLHLRVKYEIVYFPNVGGVLLLGLISGAFYFTVLAGEHCIV